GYAPARADANRTIQSETPVSIIRWSACCTANRIPNSLPERGSPHPREQDSRNLSEFISLRDHNGKYLT
ncbi:MAG: hypothetical protein ACK5PZ_08350, partial [Pirellula sp.]